MNNNVVIAQYLINLHDAQRSNSVATLSDGVVTNIKKMVISSVARGSRVVLITNDENVNIDIPGLELVVEKIPDVIAANSMYFIRWVMTLQYLYKHPEFDKVALVDATDVIMKKAPFFEMKDDVLYVGDEQADLSSSIVKFEKTNDEIKAFNEKYSYLQLLNPGVIVGGYNIVLEFLEIMCSYILQDIRHDKSFGSLEMALFNFVVYKFFSGRAIHGRLVTTLFDQGSEDFVSWFKHK
ncbi:hypothetical protein H9L19_00445 [Weissella diestrammenae]|uniref:Uncharacterized protein n=1 Tax=Weissella diestrammenae TaxID=1162633 RepID=A0A7G9T5N6_9LACO|nr:hypothetical protein [Weissella diestrammenae]MCM0582237.1 hypothetical protein [Weissella diestrammenae]QNN75411.1 hypothetical protein H9L19_00445 [Weissella diestrammenae]